MRVTDHKRRDGRRVQIPKRYRPVAEALGQEPPEQLAVGGHGGRSESPLGRQVLLVLPLQHAERRLVDHDRWRADDKLLPQMREKVMDGRRIAAMHILPSHTVIDKGLDDFIIQVGDAKSAAGHPLVEMSEKCYLRADRRGGVPESGKTLRERVKV